jgi:hypothetical protein
LTKFLLASPESTEALNIEARRRLIFGLVKPNKPTTTGSRQTNNSRNAKRAARALLFFDWLVQPVKCLVAATATAAAAVAAATGTTAAAASATAVTAAAATTGTTSAAAVSAATASAAAEAAAASAGRTCLHWTGFVHNETTTTVLLTIHAVDSSLCFSVIAHFNKAEAF